MIPKAADAWRQRTIEVFATAACSPPVDRRLPLAEARQAHELLDARAVLGKLILKP